MLTVHIPDVAVAICVEVMDEFLVDFFFRTSIRRLQNEISEKKNLTDNFINGFRFVSESEE